eukprot:Clim_evm75s215 gene=Clim_evmTU75s215
MSEQSEKKFCVVTGALGGIGRSVCKVLKESGYVVIGIDRMASKLKPEDVPADHIFTVDIIDFHRNQDNVKDFLKKAREITGGKLHLLVNNAATQIVKSVPEYTPEDWDATLQTNLTAPFFIAQAFLDDLKAVEGSVVNVASIHANLTKPGFIAYATSKGGMVSLTRSMAIELGAYGVRVNAVLPAAIDTPMLAAGFEGNAEGYQQLKDLHPVKRVGMPEEIGYFIKFLAGPEAGFITGSALQIDGGIGGRLHDPV